MTIDRRAALKERHREAILAAADELLHEGGAGSFTVDDLADRADVARRTVFNHFASVDEIVTCVCSDVLGGVIDEFVSRTPCPPAAEGSTTTILDEVAGALRSTDLVDPMAFLTRALCVYEPDSPPVASLLLRVFGELSRRLTTAITDRHPRADPIEVELLVGAVTSGLVVIHRAWWERTGAAADDAAREVWAELLDRLISVTRAGYGRPDRPTASDLNDR